MYRIFIVLVLVLVVASCSDGDRNMEPNSSAMPVAQEFEMAYMGRAFKAVEYSAYAKDGVQPESKEVLIVAKSETGDIAELHMKNVNQTDVSFNVARGALATLSFDAKDETNTCTTALTMDNDSSVMIELHDDINNTLKGSFTAVSCANLSNQTHQLSSGAFHVEYQEVDFRNRLNLVIDGTEVVPSDIFVKVIPEPMNTIQITGFNGGTQNYTLILKSDLAAGTYSMNEFDVAPYFFFTDDDLNQYDAMSGTVTLDPYNQFDRVMTGRLDILTKSGQKEVQCQGEFEIFVF